MNVPTSTTNADKQALRSHYGEPLDVAVAIMKPELDAHHRRYIEHCPFVCIAAADAAGQPTVSPKGDAPGFVKVLDAHTLVIPDRIGNNKVETLNQLVENPKLALLFMIPGIDETLRVQGSARITTDPQTLELCRVGAKLPPAALVISVTRAYFHCGKAMIRSNLWDESAKLTPGVLPTFAQIVKDELATPMSVDDLQCAIDDAYTNKLY
jgi:hypothetical protein